MAVSGNATADSDSDGQNDYTEFLLGTDAGSASENFKPLVRVSKVRSELDFVLPANRDVTIETTENLGHGNWKTVEGLRFDRYSPKRQIIRLREPPTQRRFYRIIAREP